MIADKSKFQHKNCITFGEIVIFLIIQILNLRIN